MAAMLDVDIVTGRTHQIRVHLSALGHHVIGDSVYGNPKRADTVHNTFVRSKLKAMKRQGLHAARIGFVHPVTSRDMVFTSPLPDDMAQLADFLRRYAQV
jgi:23S rRNA pseudouridine1911/1915/1917 synthase